MAAYEFYCSDCRSSFEVLRSMADADKPLQCASCGSDKHVNRAISTFAVLAGGRGTDAASLPVVAGGGGGCCGGACGCGG
jgi:putative FmdB family regulatory protein